MLNPAEGRVRIGMPSPPGCISHPARAFDGGLARQVVVVHKRPETNDDRLAVGEEWEGLGHIVGIEARTAPTPRTVDSLKIDRHEQELDDSGHGIE